MNWQPYFVIAVVACWACVFMGYRVGEGRSDAESLEGFVAVALIAATVTAVAIVLVAAVVGLTAR